MIVVMISQPARELLAKIRSLLAFQQDMGLGEVALTPEIARFLGSAPTAPRRESPGLTSPPTAGAEARLFSPAPESANGLHLHEIYQDIEGCTKCALHENRSVIVPGGGPAQARLFIIEDQPGAAEEAAGQPFAGEPGELFDKMLKAIKLDRSEVYLTSIVKCRPAADRDPKPEEIRTCLAYLARQIAAVNPAVICTMGPLSARALTGNSQSLFRFRGKFHDFHATPLLPTFHPRFLLKNPDMKKGSWADLQTIQKKLNSTGSGK